MAFVTTMAVAAGVTTMAVAAVVMTMAAAGVKRTLLAITVLRAVVRSPGIASGRPSFESPVSPRLFGASWSG
jgi:hypothetical protein